MTDPMRDNPGRPWQQLDRCAGYPYALSDYVRRAAWNLVQATLIRFSPKRAHGWRRMLLRLFGARIAPTAGTKRSTVIWHPWLLEVGDYSMLSEHVTVYNLGRVRIGSHTVLSQNVYLCAGSHDYTRADLPLLRPTIEIGHGVWICAGAFVGPGVTIGDNSVVGARAVVVGEIPPGVVAGGHPARPIKDRVMVDGPGAPAGTPQPQQGERAQSPEPVGGGQLAMSQPHVPISVLVLTKDEELNIEACLQTLAWSDDIVVFDSYSTDRTVELAERFANVRVIQRRFDTWSNHSNWALENIDFKHPWVYYSDADERVTPELRDEMARVTQEPDQPCAAFRLRYKNMFLGKWIRRSGMYPVWIIRLFKPDKVRYETRQVNAHPVVDGPMGELREHFIHYSFNKGLRAWFEKHNSYAQMEANEAVRVTRDSAWHAKARQLLEPQAEPGARRRALKNLSFHLPLRGLWRFLYMYVLRLGALDGLAGLRYCAMISMYEYWIELKMREHEADWPGQTRAAAQRLLAGGK